MTSAAFVEKALIGSLLNDSTTMRQDVTWLSAGDFTNPLCQAIWRHLASGNSPQGQPLTDLKPPSPAHRPGGANAGTPRPSKPAGAGAPPRFGSKSAQ